MSVTTIRKFNPADKGHIDAVCGLAKRNAFHYEDIWTFYRGEDRRVEGAGHNGYLLLLERRVVGFAIGTHFAADKALLEYLLVDKDYRGRGYGRRLMSHYCRKFLDFEGRKCCVLYEDKAELNKYYEEFGFDVSKRKPHRSNPHLVSAIRNVQ